MVSKGLTAWLIIEAQINKSFIYKATNKAFHTVAEDPNLWDPEPQTSFAVSTLQERKTINLVSPDRNL